MTGQPTTLGQAAARRGRRIRDHDGTRRLEFICDSCFPHRRRTLARTRAAYGTNGTRTGPIEADRGKPSAPEPAIVRDKLETSRCPTCGRGPFQFSLERVEAALDIAPADGRKLRVPI